VYHLRAHHLSRICKAVAENEHLTAAKSRRASASRMRLTSAAVVKHSPSGSQKPSGGHAPGSVRASAARRSASSSGLRNGRSVAAR
jgi:hypothetical protein